MKITATLFHIFIISSLVFFSLKPLFIYGHGKANAATVSSQYTINKCSNSRPATTFSCQSLICYFIDEKALQAIMGLFILAGFHVFTYDEVDIISPISRLFKPPIRL